MVFTKAINNMKNILLIYTLFFSSLNLYSQDNDGWLINFEEAAELSIKSGKPILANFTGSDWCGWCIRLNKEVFVTPEFKNWASENVILLELDYPRRVQQTDEIKKQNRELQQFFQVIGYPTLHIFNVIITDGKTQITSLGKMGYLAGGPTPWIASANNYIKNK